MVEHINMIKFMVFPVSVLVPQAL